MKIVNKILNLISNRTETKHKKKMEKVLKGKDLKILIKENQDIIKSTQKKSINITFTPQTNITPTTSKLGGLPYLQQNEVYPTNNETGKPLHFLAQINLEEVPHLDPFPDHGILQFFIDSLWEKNYHKVRYYKTVLPKTKLNTKIPELKQLNPEESPVLKECKLNFKKTTEYISINDYHYNELINPNLSEKIGSDAFEIKNTSGLDLTGMGSKLGGYAFSTQDYHRYNKKTQQYEKLLLQLDSDNSDILMWGDSGVGAFFIKKKDLKEKNFQDTFYSWNCY